MIEIMLSVLKKYAIINVIVTVVEMLIAKPFAILLGVFILSNNFSIGPLKSAIPVTQPKLNKNPTSNTHKGLTKNTTIPAKEIDVRLSYSFPSIFESIKTMHIIDALIMDIENPQRYA